VDRAAAILDLLSTPTRLHLMWLLAHRDHDVGWLAEQVGATVAAVSQQLGKLRMAGLVSARRVGRQQIYTADDPHILLLVDQIFAHVAPDGSLTPNDNGQSGLQHAPLPPATRAAPSTDNVTPPSNTEFDGGGRHGAGEVDERSVGVEPTAA
jgi:DNA-binding transcriptional ArsR family regulator